MTGISLYTDALARMRREMCQTIRQRDLLEEAFWALRDVIPETTLWKRCEEGWRQGRPINDVAQETGIDATDVLDRAAEENWPRRHTDDLYYGTPNNV